MWYVSAYTLIFAFVILKIINDFRNSDTSIVNEEKEKQVKTAQEYYEKKVDEWRVNNKLSPKFITDLYQSQIDWNLQMQLTWGAVLLASMVGLFELIPDHTVNFYLIHLILSVALVTGIDFGFNQVTKLVQIILRNEMIMNASLRKGKKMIIKNYKDWSYIQRNLLEITDSQPTLKLGLVLFFRGLLWLVSFLFILERLGAISVAKTLLLH